MKVTSVVLIVFLGALGCKDQAKLEKKTASVGTKALPSAVRVQTDRHMTAQRELSPPPSLDLVHKTEQKPNRAVKDAGAPAKKWTEYVGEGKSLLRGKLYAEAREAFAQAMELQPTAVLPVIEMARVFLREGKVETARTFAQDAVKMTPSSSYAWNTLGRVELAEKSLDAAITSFTRACEENPDNAYAWNNLGLTLMRQARYEEAASALENATSGQRPKPYMWNNLGNAYEHVGMRTEAIAAYRQAGELGSARGRANLSRLLEVEPHDTIEVPEGLVE